MSYPDEFIHRVYKTHAQGLGGLPKRLGEIIKSEPDTYVDVIYENLKSIIVIVFPTQEDCLAFTLKYGTNYV